MTEDEIKERLCLIAFDEKHRHSKVVQNLQRYFLRGMELAAQHCGDETTRLNVRSVLLDLELEE